MKKTILIVFASIFIVLIILASLPFIFQNTIKEKLINEIDSKIDANFYFSEIHVRSLKNFPHLTITMNNVLLTGKEAFKNDTLAYVNSISLSCDLLSIIKGRKIEINTVRLDKPYICLLVLANGKTNYDILAPEDTTVEAPKDSSAFEININKWEIKEGKIIYNDKLQKTYIAMEGLNHGGEGDFKQDISDLSIATSISELTVALNGIKYLNRKHFATDIVMEMDLKNSKFTFKDHSFRINDFKFGFDGFFKLLKEGGYETNLNFAVKETSFKNVLSLLPGVYMKDLKGINTKGEFSCDGYVKGIYNAKNNMIPKFVFNLNVIDGMFQYSHLPRAVKNINFNLTAKNNFGIPDSTEIDIKKLHLDMGKNPVHGYLKIKGLTHYYIDTDLKASLDMADLESMYPIEGTTVKGLMKIDISAKGIYDQKKDLFPALDAKIKVDSGFVQSKDYPVPMENIHLDLEAFNEDGNLSDTRVLLNNVTYTIDKEPFKITGTLSNLYDPTYDLSINGQINFGEISKIYQFKEGNISGILDIDIEGKGKLSDVENKKYSSLNNSGTLEIKNFIFNSKDFSQSFKISDALLVFNSDKIALDNFTGTFGKSTISLSGHLYNYLGYFLNENAPLKGDMKMKCDTLDINEWMTEDSSKPKDTAQSSLKVIPVPANVDFTFDSFFGFIKFDNLDINNLDGEIKIKDGVLTLKETGFDMAGAKFALSGDYDTRNPEHPLFDMVIDIEKLDINKAYNLFSTVQATSPAAENTYGLFSGNYKLKGELAPDYTPILETLTGGGTIVIAQAEVKGMKLFNHVGKITKKNELANPTLNDIKMETEIKGGKVFIKPFSFQLGKFIAEVEGSHSFNNDMNYLLKIAIPPLHKIKIPLHITGTVDKPVYKIGKGHENFDFSKI